MNTTPELTGIEIRIEPHTSSHALIEVAGTLDDPEDPVFAEVPDHEIAQALIDVAGTLARTAVRLTKLMQRLQVLHRCVTEKNVYDHDACSTLAFGPGMEPVWGEAPRVYFVVPENLVDDVLPHVQEALEQAVAENRAITTTPMRGWRWVHKDRVHEL